MVHTQYRYQSDILKAMREPRMRNSTEEGSKTVENKDVNPIIFTKTEEDVADAALKMINAKMLELQRMAADLLETRKAAQRTREQVALAEAEAETDSEEADLEAAFDGKSPATRKKYLRFLSRIDQDFGDIPITDATLRKYLWNRFQDGLSESSIRSFIVALNFRAEALGQSSPVGIKSKRMMRKITNLSRDQGRGTGEARGILPEEKERLVRICEKSAAENFKRTGIRDAALISLWYDSGAGISEPIHLELRDFTIPRNPRVAGSGLITLRKTNTGEPRTAFLTPSTVKRILKQSAIPSLTAWKAARYAD